MNKRSFFNFFLVIFLTAALLLPALPASASILDIPFGGRILEKSWEVCLIPVPPPIFFIPIPFIYILVGPPRPAALYYWFGISKKYRRDGLAAMTETSWALGIYLPGVSLLTKACANRAILPEAEGVIRRIGVSCPDEQHDECEQQGVPVQFPR